MMSTHKPQITPAYSEVAGGTSMSGNDLRHRHSAFARYQNIFWMILALVGGISFALAHHLVYNSYNGQRVQTASLDQTWLVRIGTGLAFSAKTLLAVATSIAYTQQQWRTVRTKTLKIRQIDTVSGVLSNPLNFLTSRVWFRMPLLTLLAAITWLLPISAIITPATINVVLSETNSTNHLPLQNQLYYDPNTYGNINTVAVLRYVGPSVDVRRAGYSTAMGGEILNIPAPGPNVTYSLQFTGPALRCDPADENLVDAVYDEYMRKLTGIENAYYYFSWVPTRSGRANLTETDDTLDVTSTDAAHLYIIPNTTTTGPVFVSGTQLTPEDAHYGYQDLIDCKLYNASYNVLFNYTFPTQTVRVQHRELLNPVNVSEEISEWYYSSTSPETKHYQSQRISYQAIMDTLGRLLIGYEWTRDGFVVTEKSSWAMLSVDFTSRESTQRGVEALFQNITLSLLSTESLTMNSTIAQQNQVAVTVYEYFNIYEYHVRDLWLTYGIAIVCALLCATLGVLTTWKNKAVFQDNFSSHVRVVAGQGMAGIVRIGDEGAEPLPKDLAEILVPLGRSN